MGEQSYKKTIFDPCVFAHKFFDNFIILLLCVDNMLILGKDKLKKELNKSFSMKDLRPTKQILGMRIDRDKKTKYFFVIRKIH